MQLLSSVIQSCGYRQQAVIIIVIFFISFIIFISTICQ